ncbi:11827_t:CDS:2, partial [Ambispora leptoticha]
MSIQPLIKKASTEEDEESSNSNQEESFTVGMINNHRDRHGYDYPRSSNITQVDQQYNHYAILRGSKGKHDTSQGKQLEDKQGDPDNSDEELYNILPSNILLELKNFIMFFEQQMSSDFNADNLK